MNGLGVRCKHLWVYVCMAVLVGCNLPTAKPMTPVSYFLTPTFLPSPSPWPPVFLPTPTLQSLQPLQPVQPVSTTAPIVIPAAPTISIACNRAEFVGDVSIPDGTQFSPGASFAKTWRFRNAGSCAWTSAYVLLFDHGDPLNAPSGQPVSQGTVPPGAVVDVSIQLSAPFTPGAYQAFFRMRSPDNTIFGIGSSGLDPFWVKIVVLQPNLGAVAAAGNSTIAGFEKILQFGGGGSHGYSCQYPGSQPAIQARQYRAILTLCVYWGTVVTPFQLQFIPPGAAVIQPIDLLVADPVLDGMPRMRWDGYGEAAYFDGRSTYIINTATPSIHQLETIATPTNRGTGIIVIPPGGLATIPTTSGLEIIPTPTPTSELVVLPTHEILVSQAVHSVEILAWIPNYFPNGEWRVQASDGFAAETSFQLETNGSLPRIAAINPDFGREFTPIPVDKAYLEYRLLKRKKNGGIDLVGTRFPANSPVYILLYHATDSATYSLEVQQTVQADVYGSLYVELAGPLVVGDSYLAVAVTDPNAHIVDSSGHIGLTTPHDFFKVMGP